jgi:regulator of PEP synthase PpsR (kinase-PPPase family)
MGKKLNLYLVSDSSGETVLAVSKASLVQFPDLEISEELFLLVRSNEQVDAMLEGLKDKPGLIIYTLAQGEVRDYFLEQCKIKQIPHFCPLDDVVKFLAHNLATLPLDPGPGKYKSLNYDYYEKINSINYAISHDDGQHPEDYDKAEIVLFGVSRTSKSPTSLYLANRGYRVANYPIVAGLDLQIPNFSELLLEKKVLFLGLTIAPQQLVRIRRARLSLLYGNDLEDTFISNYSCEESILHEIQYAKSLFRELRIPIINVTNKAIEETAAEIINFYHGYKKH